MSPIDRSRNQFKQLIDKGFYFVDGSAISNAEKERFYSDTRITKKSTALWVRSRCFGVSALVDIADYLKVGLRDI